MLKCQRCWLVTNKIYSRGTSRLCKACVVDELEEEAAGNNIKLGCDCGCGGDYYDDLINEIKKGGD